MLYNDDPRELLSFIFEDCRGNRALAAKKHPKFPNLAFREFLPKLGLFTPLSSSQTNVVLNYDFWVDDMQHFRNVIVGSWNNATVRDTVFYPWHLTQTARQNRYEAVNIPHTKKFLFDALLGINKWHRIDLFDALWNTGIIEDGLISLTSNPQLYPGGVNNRTFESDALRWYDEQRVLDSKTNLAWNSMGIVDYSPDVTGKQYWSKAPVSQLIPRRIYANSWFSVISETCPAPYEFFPTEKTAKAIAAGRIFLVSAEQHFLKNLRSLGFKTFNGLIDESYDDCATIEDRNQKIAVELSKLATIDPIEIYHSALLTLQHNQKVLYSGKLLAPVKEYLLSL